MDTAFPRFYEREDRELIVKIRPQPWLIYIICSVFRICTAACFFALFGTKMGEAVGASTFGWVVGFLVGLTVSPFVRILIPRYSMTDPVSIPRGEINYPGAREIALQRFDYDGTPIRTFVLPRPTLAEWWMSEPSGDDGTHKRTFVLPRLSLLEWKKVLVGLAFQIVVLSPIGLGWISLAWMALAFSPWGHAGLLTAKIAARLMLDTAYLSGACLLLALLIIGFFHDCFTPTAT